MWGGMKGGEWVILGCVVWWGAYSLMGGGVLGGIEGVRVRGGRWLMGGVML